MPRSACVLVAVLTVVIEVLHGMAPRSSKPALDELAPVKKVSSIASGRPARRLGALGPPNHSFPATPIRRLADAMGSACARRLVPAAPPYAPVSLARKFTEPFGAADGSLPTIRQVHGSDRSAGLTAPRVDLRAGVTSGRSFPVRLPLSNARYIPAGI